MAEQWKTEFDQRQYELMDDQLRGYQEGRISLDSLIVGLEALLQCLEGQDDGRKRELHRNWGILEEIYAAAANSAEQRPSPNIEVVLQEPHNQTLIHNTVRCLRAILADRKCQARQK